MDIDFHFGTIYVLSRWAGFDNQNAFTIASTSQFVDDNEPYLESSRNLPLRHRFSGHAITENITDNPRNNSIWVPFHFLPGIEGNTDEERLICKKNSLLAQQLADKILQLDPINKPDDIFRLGVCLHVYADTWSHQEFSGIISGKDNSVENLHCSFPVASELKIGEQVFFRNLPMLGHARAAHFPDSPYVSWQCDPDFSNGRKNWEEFLEASDSIYNLLGKLHGNTTAKLSQEQRDKLSTVFRGIITGEYKLRNTIWIGLINSGFFGDQYTADGVGEYSMDYILDDDNFSKSFYCAINEHYEWVKEKLEENNLYNVLS